MGMSTSARRIAAAGFGAIAVATVLPSGTAHAERLCNVNQNTWVRDYPAYGSAVKYTIPAGGGWREQGTYNGWSTGNGNGQPSGWVPIANLNC